MYSNKSYGYILAAIVSFILGFLYFTSKSKKPLIDEDFNRTVARQKDGKYFLFFNGPVVFSREVTRNQYEMFMAAYPKGYALSNVLDSFSFPPTKYTYENGKYYEYTWNGKSYNKAIEITKEEYNYLKKDSVNYFILENSLIF